MVVSSTCSPPDASLGNIIARKAINKITIVTPIAIFIYCFSVTMINFEVGDCLVANGQGFMQVGN